MEEGGGGLYNVAWASRAKNMCGLGGFGKPIEPLTPQVAHTRLLLVILVYILMYPNLSYFGPSLRT